MKTFYLLACCCMHFGPLHAQLSDDFEDNDLSMAPTWLGMVQSFSNANGRMQSNSQIANTVFYTSTSSQFNKNCQWMISCELAFNPSSLNYIDFFLFSDSLQLSNATDALFVRLGGSNDEISLFKLSKGVETKLIDGKDGILNTSSNKYVISVLSKGDSFYLSHSKTGSQTWSTEGVAKVSQFAQAYYTGIRIRQSSSSFFNKHFFDDLYIGPEIKDSLAPLCDSIKVINPNTIHCYFNEVCDSLSLKNKAAFYLNTTEQTMDSCSVFDGGRSVLLRFKENLKVNSKNKFVFLYLKDLAGNFRDSFEFVFNYILPQIPQMHQLLITEMMVDPEPAVALPEKEYVEIKNVSANYLALRNCSIQDPNNKILLPDIILAPDSFLVLDKIPSLNNSSDIIQLRNGNGVLLHEVAYFDSWYRDNVKKNGGYSLEMIDVSKFCLQAENWKASISKTGGTPGRENSVKAFLPKDTLAPQILSFQCLDKAMIQLYFDVLPDTSSPILWSINQVKSDLELLKTDVSSRSQTFQFPRFPALDSIYILEVSGFRDCEGNLSKGFEMHAHWPGLALRNDILINEILFNPSTGGKDFIELINRSHQSFNLSELFVADLDAGGRLKNIYPLSKTYRLFEPGKYALLTEDTLTVCNTYFCRNSEALMLQMSKLPSMPDDAGQIVVVNLNNQTIDSLSYSANWHFSLLSDKNGVSLERLDNTFETNNPNNWHSAASVYGFATPGAQNSQFHISTSSKNKFTLSSQTLSPDLDGHEDLMVLNYQLLKPDYAVTIQIYDINGRLIRMLLNNQTLGSAGFISWDGCGNNAEKLPVGIYVVLIEGLHPDGELIREKLTVVLAEKI